MRKTILLFLLLFFLITMIFNCQQSETESKIKYKVKKIVVTVPAEPDIKCAVIFDKHSSTGGSDVIIATYRSAMPAASAPARTERIFTGTGVRAGGQKNMADRIRAVRAF